MTISSGDAWTTLTVANLRKNDAVLEEKFRRYLARVRSERAKYPSENDHNVLPEEKTLGSNQRLVLCFNEEDRPELNRESWKMLVAADPIAAEIEAQIAEIGKKDHQSGSGRS